KGQRLLAGTNGDVGHANHGQAVPALGAQGATGAGCADRVRSLAGAEVSGEQAVRDDGSALRGDAFVVEAEGAQAGAVLLARVGDHVDEVTAIAERAELVERQEGSAREVGFHPQYAVEFDGMSDGLVDLQAEL